MNGHTSAWLNHENSAFCASLCDIELPLPNGLKAWHGKAVTKRFQVYRNNIYSGLLDALAAQFPIVQQLVGDEFFRAMARVYVGHNLPATPKLFEYGRNFPEFISEFEHAQNLSYLSDVAQLEWLWNCAYHAEEALPLTAEIIAQIPPEAMSDLSFSFHPSFQLIQSDYPVVSIWAAHQNEAAFQDIAQQSEAAFIIRPEAEVIVVPIMLNMVRFITALSTGQTLGEALELGYDEKDPFDVSHCLATLIQQGCFIAYKIGDSV